MGWIVLDPAPEIEIIGVDIHSSGPEHHGKAKVETPRTVHLADGDEANGGDTIEAVADGSAARARMHYNPLHRRPQVLDEAAPGASATRSSVAHVIPMHPPQALDEAAASDLNPDESPSDRTRRESHVQRTRERRY